MTTATLITNIRAVLLNDVRLFAHAVLLEEKTEDLPAKLRGFSTKGTLPVFEMVLEDTVVALALNGTRTDLLFGAGLRVSLVRHDPQAPLDLQSFEVDEHNETYESIWAELAEKVLRYWPLAHLVPHTTFLPLQ